MKRLAIVFATVLAALFIASASQSQPAKTETPTEPRSRIRVAISVTCDDQALKDQVYGNFHRSLRTLDNVTVVPAPSSPDYLFSIIILQDERESGARLPNYSMSIVLTQPLTETLLRSHLRPQDVPLFEGRELHLHQRLRSGPLRTLREDCEDVVSAFDRDWLQPRRNR